MTAPKSPAHAFAVGCYCCLLLLALTPARAKADPATIPLSYVGRLVDAQNTPLVGSVDLQIAYFPAATGGTALGNSPYTVRSVGLKDGIYRAQLGLSLADAALIFVDASQPVWVEITDLTHNQVYPRQIAMVTPWALRIPVDGSTVDYGARGLVAGQLPLASVPDAVAALTGKATTANLDAALATKAALSHTHAIGDIAALSPALAALAPLAHSHSLLGDAAGDVATPTVTGLFGLPVNQPIFGTDNNNYLKLNAAGTHLVWAAAGTSGSGTSGVSAVGGVAASQPLLVSGGGGNSVNLSLNQGTSVAAGYVSASSYLNFAAKQSTLNGSSTIGAGSLIAARQDAFELIPYAATAGATGQLRFDALNGSGSFYVGFRAPDSLPQTTVWALPAADGGSNQALATDGGSNMKWNPLIVGTATNVSVGSGLIGGPITSAGTLALATLGTAGSYSKIAFNNQGLVMSGQSLGLADIPKINAATFTAGTLAASLGGTNASAPLAGNSALISSGGAIVESGALGGGQMLIGRAGTAPLAATITTDTTQGITVTAGSGSLQLGTVQDIRTVAMPTFAALTVGNPVSSLVQSSAFGTWQTATVPVLNATVGYAALNKAGDSGGSLSLGANALQTTGLVVGTGDASPSASAGTVRGPAAVGVNLSAGNLTFDAANGTGTGGSGALVFATAPPGASSATPNTLQTAVKITSSGLLGVGVNAPSSVLDVNGSLTHRGLAAPAVSSAGQGRLYFDSTSKHFYISENGNTYIPLNGGGSLTSVVLGAGFVSGTISGSSGIVNLATLIAPGTLVKPSVGAQGLINGAGTLVLADLPPLPAATLTTGTLPLALGGTGANFYANGSLLVANGSTGFATAGTGAVFNTVTVNATGSPTFSALNLAQSAALSGTLAVGNGGSGATTAVANSVFAAPNGSSGAPAFRGLVATDYPGLIGDSGTGGASGAAPAPGAGDAAVPKFLRADATWGNAGLLAAGATGQIQFGNAGVLAGNAKLTWSAAGKRVGLGTTSPASWLDVTNAAGSGAPSLNGLLIGSSPSFFSDSATGSGSTVNAMAFHALSQPTLAANNTGVITTNAYTQFIGGAPKWISNNTATNAIALGVGSAAVGAQGNSYGLAVSAQSGATNNYAAIFQGGNVGIGTTAPAYALDINGSLRAGGLISATATNFGMQTLDNLLAVGIGSTVPAADLSLGGTLARVIDVDRATTPGNGYSLTVEAGGAIVGGSNYNGGNLVLSSGIATGNGSSQVQFSTAVGSGGGTIDSTMATQMVVLSTGNVGMGTTTPKSTLDVNGGLAIGSYAGTAKTTVGGLLLSGNVGIGTSQPVAKIDLGGNAMVRFESAANLASDFSVLMQQDNSTNTANCAGSNCGRFSLATLNDVYNTSGDEVWLQGGQRLVFNAGNWDSELNATVGAQSGTLVSGVEAYEWRVNNNTVASLTAPNYFGIGTNAPVAPLELKLATWTPANSSTQTLLFPNRWCTMITPGDGGASGCIDYRTFDSASLGIVGAASINRPVRFFDTMSVGGSAPTSGVAYFNGNVGIGTSAPAFALQVPAIAQFGGGLNLGQTFTKGIYGDGTNLALHSYGTTGSNIYFQTANGAGTLGVITGTSFLGVGTGNPGGPLDVRTASNAGSGTNGASITVFAQNGGTGNTNGGFIYLVPGAQAGGGTPGGVGIGTTQPAGMFDVRGGTAPAGSSGSPVNIYGLNGGTGNTNGGYIFLMPGSASNAGTSGFVGIGTTSPAGMLDVRSGTATSGNDGGAIYLGGQNAGAGGHNGGGFAFMPGAASGAGTGGYVGVNTATPAGTLDVRGGTASSGSGASVFLMAQSGGGTSQNGGNIVLVPGSSSGTGSVGSVGVANASPLYPLDVGGDINTSGCVRRAGVQIAGTCASDARFKRFITTMHGALGRVLRLRPVSYRFRQNDFPHHHFGSSREYGLIAQEVAEVFPGWVSADADGYLRVDYGLDLQIQVIAATQELQRAGLARRDDLWARLARLDEVHASGPSAFPSTARLARLVDRAGRVDAAARDASAAMQQVSADLLSTYAVLQAGFPAPAAGGENPRKTP